MELSNSWYYFWTANFLIASFFFVVIALVVLVRGVGELREMLKDLRRSHHSAAIK